MGIFTDTARRYKLCHACALVLLHPAAVSSSTCFSSFVTAITSGLIHEAFIIARKNHNHSSFGFCFWCTTARVVTLRSVSFALTDDQYGDMDTPITPITLHQLYAMYG